MELAVSGVMVVLGGWKDEREVMVLCILMLAMGLIQHN